MFELNFTEAAGIFKALQNEEALKSLTESHYDQVNFALNKFTETQQQQAVKKVTKRNLNPTEKRVLPKIQALQLTAKDQADIDLLKGTENAIWEGTLKRLPGELDKFFKTYKISAKPEYLKKLIYDVLKAYSILFSQPDEYSEEQFKIQKPVIVISESFK